MAAIPEQREDTQLVLRQRLLHKSGCNLSQMMRLPLSLALIFLKESEDYKHLKNTLLEATDASLISVWRQQGLKHKFDM